MTIASTETKVIYGGNGSTRAFAIPFMFLRNEDIRVLLVDAEDAEWTQSEGTDYALSGVGEQTGGALTMSLPPEAGQTLVIRREPAMVQEVDYVENDAFPAATHEAALDKLTMICQALAEKLDRALTFRVSSAMTGVNLPEPDADRVLAWNGTGDDLVNKDVVSLGLVTTPVPISQGGTDADNPTEALFNLGFGAVGLTVAGCEEEAEALAAIGAEPADPDILKADTADLLQAVYGDEAGVFVGSNIFAVVPTRNHTTWTLTETSYFSLPALPYDGTYVYHIYPDGHTLSISVNWKLPDGGIDDPDPSAGEIRIVVERYLGRKSIVSLQNMGA